MTTKLSLRKETLHRLASQAGAVPNPGQPSPNHGPHAPQNYPSLTTLLTSVL